MTSNERVKFLRKEELNLTQEDFANKIGTVKSTISMIESGKHKLTKRNITLICKEFNVREDWLKNGTGEIFDEKPKEINVIDLLREKGINNNILEIMENYINLSKSDKLKIDESIQKLLTPKQIEKAKEKAKETLEELKTEETYEIKLYETPVSAGEGIGRGDIEEHETIKTSNPNANYALKVKGDSMEPMYKEGDIIFVREQDFLDSGEIGVFIYDNESYLKQYVIKEDGAYLVSLNKKYPPIKIEENVFFKICGLVL